MANTLFDIERLTPADLVKRRGTHPASGLAVDDNPDHTCQNCANRRDVWIADSVGPTCRNAARWEQVCTLGEPACSNPFRASLNWPGTNDRIITADYHDTDEECCNASCCAPHARALFLDGYDPLPAWPWPSRIRKRRLPACVGWADLESELVLAALARKKER